MNRIVLIGNGFDLAHGLKTRYEDFINWYWDQRLHSIVSEHNAVSADVLCSMKILSQSGCENWYLLSYNNSFFKDLIKNEWRFSGREFIEELKSKPNCFEITYSSFFKNICNSIETKGWVDIENEYYELLTKYALDEKSANKVNDLNTQLHFLQEKLIEYLSNVTITEDAVKSAIKKKIYSPFMPSDISIEGQHALREHIKQGLQLNDRGWEIKLYQYEKNNLYCKSYIDEYKEQVEKNEKSMDANGAPEEFLLPNQIMLLNFNYTQTARMYYMEKSTFTINQIHGEVEKPQSVIFGYGDELDEKYKTLLNQNDNTLLGNIKSIKYMEADHYRKILAFIESEPYKNIIMGHSCGNSDRTLLNTLFEHKNCVSIKPYYYKKGDGTDNYIELIQNISRNFTDMKLMRDRVVNKTYCEPLVSNN